MSSKNDASAFIASEFGGYAERGGAKPPRTGDPLGLFETDKSQDAEKQSEPKPYRYGGIGGEDDILTPPRSEE